MAKFKFKYAFALAIAALLFATAAIEQAGCKTRNKSVRAKDPSMDEEGFYGARNFFYNGIPAVVKFKFASGGDETKARMTTERIWSEFERLGKIFSAFDPAAEVCQINADKQKIRRKVSPELYEALQLSKNMRVTTGGAFDASMLGLKKLWKNAEKKGVEPTREQLAQTLAHCGMDKINILDGGEIEFVDPAIELDLGGIAKGYAVDKAAALLQEAGALCGLVQLGGETAAFGGAACRKKWRVAIEDPINDGRLYATVESADKIRVSTSGNARQPILIGGKSYYHIFSLADGMPIDSKIASVTTAAFDDVFSSAQLDAAATSIAVLGAEKGKKLAEKIGLKVIILTVGADGGLVETSVGDFYRKEPPFPAR